MNLQLFITGLVILWTIHDVYTRLNTKLDKILNILEEKNKN